VGAAVYGALVFLGTAAIGFVLAPLVGHATGVFPIEVEAQAFFSLLTLKSVPYLFGLSASSSIAWAWGIRLGRLRCVALYLANTLLAYAAGVAAGAVW
jgi:hypothetical protein